MTTTSRSRQGLLPRVAFALAVVLQLVALYVPRVETPGGLDVPGSDKVAHAVVFGLVMLTGILAGLPARRLALVLAAHAVLSEVLQHALLPDRSGDPLDVVADLAGVALGWYVATMVTRHRTTT